MAFEKKKTVRELFLQTIQKSFFKFKKKGVLKPFSHQELKHMQHFDVEFMKNNKFKGGFQYILEKHKLGFDEFK